MGNTAGVPTIYLGLLDYMAANNKKLHYLKSLVCGGAACPPKVFDAFDRSAVGVALLMHAVCLQHTLAAHS